MTADPTVDELERVEAPADVTVVLPCPDCGAAVSVLAHLSARRVRDSDGTTTLALRTRAAKVAHMCGQVELGLASGPLSR